MDAHRRKSQEDTVSEGARRELETVDGRCGSRDASLPPHQLHSLGYPSISCHSVAAAADTAEAAEAAEADVAELCYLSC